MITIKKTVWMLIFFSLGLTACSSPNKTKSISTNIYTVSARDQVTPLYFTGTIAPLEIVNIASPVDGNVKKLYFRYGERVKKNQELLLLQSDKLMTDYQTALTSFLEAKDKYLASKVQMEGTEELYQAGLIPRNDYQNDKSNLADNYLSYTQAENKLKSILKNAKGFLNEDADITQLNLEDEAEVQKALNVKLNELSIQASNYGIILMPIKEGGSSSDDSAKILREGSQVKQGQTLVSLGDFSGLSININVNEININAIKPGQAVKVTGVAFPDITLDGKVMSIDVQAAAAENGGGLPTFPVTIVVPHLTPQQQETIHIGMSAKVELFIQNGKQIMIPIKAIVEKNGQSYVQLVTSENPLKTQEVLVQTGQPEINDVVIKQGLKVGDKILVNH
ncbi:MAG: efflux RND transporter periplasmic adaptor subunit [Legionellales bacterium]|nr:efflux RND transporter periplasmic adaptor subunit [Legionellales bacterium]